MRIAPAALARALVCGLAALAAAAGGCAAHVQIDPPPPPTASLATRQDYFDGHRAAKAERGELVARTRLFASRPTWTRKALHLNNGLRVAHVEDLAPLVPPQSEVAAAIDEAVAARDTANLITGAGVGVAAVGIGTGLGLLGAYIGFATPENPEAIPDLVIAGITTAVAGALAGSALMGWGLAVRDDEEDARARVYGGFDDALRARLGLAPAAVVPSAPAP